MKILNGIVDWMFPYCLLIAAAALMWFLDVILSSG